MLTKQSDKTYFVSLQEIESEQEFKNIIRMTFP